MEIGDIVTRQESNGALLIVYEVSKDGTVTCFRPEDHRLETVPISELTSCGVPPTTLEAFPGRVRFTLEQRRALK